MNILPVTNRQNTNTKQNPSFGMFITTEKQALPFIKELIGDVFALSDVVQKGSSEVQPNGFAHIGNFLTQRERDLYSKLENHFLTKTDMTDLTSPLLDKVLRAYQLLDVKAKLAKTITAKAAEAALLTAKADNMSEEAVKRAIKTLGLE